MAPLPAFDIARQSSADAERGVVQVHRHHPVVALEVEVIGRRSRDRERRR
jgi:hypothetical protein